MALFFERLFMAAYLLHAMIIGMLEIWKLFSLVERTGDGHLWSLKSQIYKRSWYMVWACNVNAPFFII